MNLEDDNSILAEIATFGLALRGDFKARDTSEITSSAIGVGFETLDRKMFKAEETYEHLGRLGAKWARCQTGWNRCETTKGEYDFAWLDDVTDNLLKAGVQPWFSLSFGNQLYMEGVPETAVGCVPLYFGDEAISGWSNFVGALIRHFKGRVSHYEVWNEPNHPSFWYPATPCPEDYAKLVEITAQAVKAEMPDAVLIGGSTAGLDLEFAERILVAGAGTWLNRYSFHPYCLVPEAGYTNSIACLKALMAKYAPHVKLWQGENGCPSVTTGHNDDWLGLFKMNETIQAKWAMRRLLTDLREDLELASYFHIADLMEEEYVQACGKRKPVMMGLLHGKTYTPKQSFAAVQNICSLFDSDTVRDKLLFFRQNAVPAREKLKYTSMVMDSYRRNGYPMYVYYCPEDPQCETATFKHPSLQICNQAEHRMDEPILIDPLTSHTYEITEVEPVKNKQKETNLLNLPVTDYPLIITDRKAILLSPTKESQV
jgi:hypothetical protein